MAEYKLSYTANEIDRRLGEIDNAVKYTEQALTEDQKAQARANIGAMAEGAGNIPGGVSSWNDLEDKPFSKEIDPAVYTVSNFEQLTEPLYNAEDYTHGTQLCEIKYIPGSVTVNVSNFLTDKSIPIAPIDQYYALGKFEVNGNKFGIYIAYNGRGYAVYALAQRSNLYGQTFTLKDMAKIGYLPTEYINIVELKSLLGLPLPVYDGEVVPV